MSKSNQFIPSLIAFIVRYVFFQLLHRAAHHLKMDSNSLTLQQVSAIQPQESSANTNVSFRKVADSVQETSKAGQQRRVTEATKRRQMEVVQYFESRVKDCNISDYC